MKASLAYQYKAPGSPCCVSDSRSDKKIHYPCITIYLTEENAELMKSIPMTGKATIQFKTKKISVGEQEYGGVEGEKGCIELEVHDIQFPDNQKAMLNMSAGEALDEYMKGQKSNKNATPDEDDDEDYSE